MGVFIVSHKKFDLEYSIPDNYRKIFVGSVSQELAVPGDLTDSSGDNIAQLNSSFCELTAIYWIWKNNEDDYKGIVHYRRLFKSRYRRGLLTNKEIRHCLEDADIIAPPKYWLLAKTGDHYAKHHDVTDLKILREAIQKISPEYLPSFDTSMQERYVYPYNMFIAKKELFDRYCEWLFSVLFEVQKHVTAKEDAYQNRVYGFLSERLMNVFIKHHGLKIYEDDIILTDRNWKRDVSMLLAKLLYGNRLIRGGRS